MIVFDYNNIINYALKWHEKYPTDIWLIGLLIDNKIIMPLHIDYNISTINGVDLKNYESNRYKNLYYIICYILPFEELISISNKQYQNIVNNLILEYKKTEINKKINQIEKDFV